MSGPRREGALDGDGTLTYGVLFNPKFALRAKWCSIHSRGTGLYGGSQKTARCSDPHIACYCAGLESTAPVSPSFALVADSTRLRHVRQTYRFQPGVYVLATQPFVAASPNKSSERMFRSLGRADEFLSLCNRPL